jgi:dipeptidyl aminopeptidase/acylaminoacyl peptidase
MNRKTMKEVAWIGDKYVKGKIKGVVMVFHGLGGGIKTIPCTGELAWAHAGGLVVFPYYGPWAWMNRQARAMVNELVDAVYSAYGLSDKAPLISTGDSMGGQASLLFTRYAKRRVTACLANCPVCDMKFHFRERPDLPTTIRCAFSGYEGRMEDILEEHSPLHQIDSMPDIPYRIVHGTADPAVSKKHHSDRMVAAMRKRKMKVEYVEVPGMGHCGPLPLEILQGDADFIAKALRQRL